MNINATLFGQMITFALFIWVTMKYIWPHIMQAIETRQTTIAEGLAQAEAGRESLTKAEADAKVIVDDAKKQAAELLKEAKVRANGMVEDAKSKAREEGQRIVEQANADIMQQRAQVKQALVKEVAGLALMGAEKVIQKELSASANQAILDSLIEEI